MEYELFINTKLQGEEVGGLLYKIVSDIIDEEVEFKKIKHTLGYQYVLIRCSYFSIDIDLDDEDNDMEEYQKINTKYHSINTNMRISIEILSKTFRTGWLKLLQIIGIVLKTIDGDLLLLDDTSFPVMKRKDNILFINNHLDEYRIEYMTKENLKLLNYPFIEYNFSE